jgi:hypothetical protein
LQAKVIIVKKFQLIAGVVLSAVVFHAMADDGAGQAQADDPVDTQEYSYSTQLDVAKVVSMSTIPDVCGVVPAKMVYEDSQGRRHALIYKVMGGGCSNG